MRHLKPVLGTVTALLVLAASAAGPVRATNKGGTTTDTGGKGENVQMNVSATVKVPSNSALGAIQRMRAGGAAGTAAVEVTADNELAVRSAKVFGPNIIGTIKKGDQFKVKGRDMAWFDIEFTASPAYVYITLVTSDEGQKMQTDPGATAAQGRIKQAAYNVLNQVPFPYDPATQGGNLGCAQVVTTALKAAGILDRISLGVLETIDLLKAKGWRFVQPPPYQDGDVVTWKTYDRTGDGVKDEDTHIGIVIKENGTDMAMNNSSSHKRPEKHVLSTYYAPVSHVLRMPGA